MGKVVGIDLGTTNSVVAVMEGGKPIVIANAEGMRTTPSVVAFTKDGEKLVGQMARRQSVLNPQNTFYGVKRFMGRRYTEVNPDAKRVPYTIRRDETGSVRIVCPRLKKDFAPEEISAMVLRKLAEEATRYLGESVTGAVITVPAYFNDAQRQATRDAGRIAGLEVLRILNEPTAAALAYGLDRADNETILVFDLGGGTFDVSILDVGDGVFEVKATCGDTQLGGNDFDKRIVDWLADQFLEQHGIDLRNDRQSLQRLMEAAEKAKIELSGTTVTEINLPFIAATEDGPLHLETRLTRSQFEGFCSDLVNRLRQPVKQALTDAQLSPARIDQVVLVGGGSRMPMVKQLVRSLIDLEPNENVNPDEVVAVGAAIQAGILTQEVRDILLLDVTPLSIGLETIGGVTKKLIPRNTTIPVRRSDVFSTSENNQTMVEVHVVQGEREMANDNKSLGRFKLMGIPPAPRGIPQILVSLDIDANGILQVTALDKTTGREQGLTIQGASNLNEAEVQRMIQEAEKFADQDRQLRDRIEKRTKAEALTFEAERQLREVALDFGMQFASSYRRRIENLVQELRGYLKQNDDRGIDITQADLRDAIYELQQEVYSLTRDDEDEKDFFGSIRRTLSSIGDDLFGDDDDYYYDDRRDYGRDLYGRDSRQDYGRDYRQDYRQDNGSRNNGRDAFGSGGSDYYSGREDYRKDTGKDSRNNLGRESFGRSDYRQDDYRQDDYRRNDSSRENLGKPGRDDYDRADLGRGNQGYRDENPRDLDPFSSRNSRRAPDADNWEQPRDPSRREPRDPYGDEPRSPRNAGRGEVDRQREPYAENDRYLEDRYDADRSRPRDPYAEDDYPQGESASQRYRRDARRSYPPSDPYTNAADDDWDDDDEW
ncbi:molecular chaperone DnaK [Leptolyngbya sp. FACHB-711]|uniref:molecular chaperone DnaK n=1 Tax=unclassified Leptolyngbya TaxID=2650499 RepID=UPI0016847B9A|nr:molecular chaperone DnaK [Leptolyngbya sp. FACHB-711]MBD1851956.1 molecular chaperone DnaK [Cyanobacteria bacterium FACHB-502]MBD2027761.1 molecular chaperone DnaK [Leptolyngbya sp. FACHB-711]